MKATKITIAIVLLEVGIGIEAYSLSPSGKFAFWAMLAVNCIAAGILLLIKAL